jgi:hypothetical protein
MLGEPGEAGVDWRAWRATVAAAAMKTKSSGDRQRLSDGNIYVSSSAPR